MEREHALDSAIKIPANLMPGDSAINSVMEWVLSALLGSAATSIAVIAVAGVGFMMLRGRVDVRRATQAIIGCFVLFGASSIAAGIVAAVQGGAEPADILDDAEVMFPTPPARVQPASASDDPYAGAAAPRR
jgi:type IV secretory pathway VirB2 component (pilin)